jgi:hypothetical protein
MGTVWGAVAATVALQRRAMVDVAWLAASTTAVAASAALVSGRASLGGHALLGAAAGWLLRRTLESLLGRQQWT